MCQTAIISHSISRVSKKSFNQRIKISISPTKSKNGEFTRINNLLDKLYDDLRDTFHTITEDDYKVIRPQLLLLIETIQGMLVSVSKFPQEKQVKISDNISRLKCNITAFEELDHDIQNFRINIFKNPSYAQIIETAKSLQ